MRRKEEIIPGDGIASIPHSHGLSTFSSETSFQRPGGPEDAFRAQRFFVDRFDCAFIS